VTDANLFLGRLDPSYFLGGRMTLDHAAAEQALASVASEVGLTTTELAEGMLAIVNARMADAMRTITVRQGIDPREYALVAFGGAGPMHAVWLAEELEIGEVIVPWSPGTFSAWGMLQTDLRHDVVRSFYRPLAELAGSEVAEAYAALQAEADALLEREGVPTGDRYFQRSADMRYVGQEYTVNVAVAEESSLEEIDGSFHEGHRVRYGHSTPGAPVEFVNLRVAAMGRIGTTVAAFHGRSADTSDPLLGRRGVIFGGIEHETPVLLRDRLQPDRTYDGPAVIEEDSSTTVVPPGHRARIDEHGNMLITRGEPT
jgi:N-methylhydantoinase A